MERQKKTEQAEKTEKRRFTIHKQKSYLTAGVLMLVAVVAMAGVWQKEKKQAEKAQTEMAAVEEQNQAEENYDTDDSAETTQETMASNPVNGNQTQENEADTTQTEMIQDAPEEPEIAGQVQTEEPIMHFSASDTIGWPLEGDVILNYSMDSSVYFATLDQYKYNPAVIIAGAVNDKVVAAADGQVIGVDTTAETGQTVTVGLGDGYQAIYGQLKEIEVSAGDYVSEGDTIGYLAEPTKYYTVEGANLYFAMTKEGKPVNPMDYIR